MTQNAEYACEEDVPEPPGYWHSHRCGNRAKWTVQLEDRRHPVCGIHVRWYQRRGVFEIAHIDCSGDG